MLANRELRRKSDELLAQVKPEISMEDAELILGDLTGTHFKGSVLRKRLRKSSTVSVGEKVKVKLEKRKEMVGRRVDSHRLYDAVAEDAVGTLGSLKGEQLVDCVKRAVRLLRGGDPIEWMRLMQSNDPVDRALSFLEQVARGDCRHIDALRRNQALCESFQAWKDKANRILTKENRPAQEKRRQKLATKKKVNGLRLQSRQS